MKDNTKKENYIKQAWLVIFLSLFFGVILAAVQITLSDRINSNKLKETIQQIPALVPGAEKGELLSLPAIDVYRAIKGDRQIGWVVPLKGQGFADKVELLVGFDAEVKNITGVYVLDQKETPGLGNKIVEDVWRNQFNNKSAEKKLVVIKTPSNVENSIVAVVGATISSDTVCNIINTGVKEFADILKENVKKN